MRTLFFSFALAALFAGCVTMDFKVGAGGCAVFRAAVADKSVASGQREVVLTACGETWDAAIVAMRRAVGGEVIALTDAKACRDDCSKIAEAWMREAKPVNDGDTEVKNILTR